MKYASEVPKDILKYHVIFHNVLKSDSHIPKKLVSFSSIKVL